MFTAVFVRKKPHNVEIARPCSISVIFKRKEGKNGNEVAALKLSWFYLSTRPLFFSNYYYNQR